jgi:hypothetical protein
LHGYHEHSSNASYRVQGCFVVFRIFHTYILKYKYGAMHKSSNFMDFRGFIRFNFLRLGNRQRPVVAVGRMPDLGMDGRRGEDNHEPSRGSRLRSTRSRINKTSLQNS